MNCGGEVYQVQNFSFYGGGESNFGLASDCIVTEVKTSHFFKVLTEHKMVCNGIVINLLEQHQATNCTLERVILFLV